MRVDVYSTFDAVLSCVCPTHCGHPFTETLRAFEFTEASLLSLIRSQTIVTRISQGAVSDEMSLAEAQVAKIAERGLLTGTLSQSTKIELDSQSRHFFSEIMAQGDGVSGEIRNLAYGRR